MLGAVNHLPAMLAIPLRQLPTPNCPRPPRGPFLPRLLPFPSPPPSEGTGEGSEAPSVANISVVNVNEPRVPSPTSMPSLEHEERGRDTFQVRGEEGEASSTSLALGGGGGGGESSQPQPDPLEDKSPPLPNQLRLKISCHHVDDWGVEGEDRVPSPALSPLQGKRRREERERGMDRTRAPDFQEKSARRRSPPTERPQPHGRYHRTATARLRSPPVRALPAGDSRIHWGLIRPYDAQTEFSEHVSRPRDQSSRHNTVANSVWQQAEARNRSREWEPRTHRIITVKSLTARCLGPRNRGLLRFSPHRQTLTIARLNRPDTRNRATTVCHGISWTIQPATAYTKPSDRKRLRQRHSTVPLVPTSRTGIIASVLLRCPRKAETRQCTLSQTPTRRTPRPALIGCTHLHTRLPAEQKILSRDTASAAPGDSWNLHTAITSQSRLPPTRPNFNPRRRETRLTPGLPRQETSTTTVRSLSLLPKTNRITRSPPSLT